jgi:hypothetical protein
MATRSATAAASSSRCVVSEDGRAGAGALREQRPRGAARDRVEPGGRLVEEQHLGAADEREREREPLLLPPDSAR